MHELDFMVQKDGGHTFVNSEKTGGHTCLEESWPTVILIRHFKARGVVRKKIICGGRPRKEGVKVLRENCASEKGFRKEKSLFAGEPELTSMPGEKCG